MKKNFILLGMLLLFLSCTNPFSTRESEVEQPDPDSNSALFDQPISEDVVLKNLRYAIIQKNVSNYMRCFIDESLVSNHKFRFIPDNSLQSEQFENWGLIDENNYLTNIVNSEKNIKSIELSYTGDEINYTTITASRDSFQTTLFEYEFKIDFGDTTHIYLGKARMKLVKNINALWAIYFWEDIRSDIESFDSWSVLKANFR